MPLNLEIHSLNYLPPSILLLIDSLSIFFTHFPENHFSLFSKIALSSSFFISTLLISALTGSLCLTWGLMFSRVKDWITSYQKHKVSLGRGWYSPDFPLPFLLFYLSVKIHCPPKLMTSHLFLYSPLST